MQLRSILSDCVTMDFPYQSHPVAFITSRFRPNDAHFAATTAVELADIEPVVPESEIDVLALDEALDQLAARDATSAELVKLRFFAGLTAAQAALALGVSERTADRIWAYARSFLLKELGPTKA